MSSAIDLAKRALVALLKTLAASYGEVRVGTEVAERVQGQEGAGCSPGEVQAFQEGLQACVQEQRSSLWKVVGTADVFQV